MRCHYIRDSIAGVVLIPGCSGVGYTGEIGNCHCNANNDFGRSFNRQISTLRRELLELRKCVDQQAAIISLGIEKNYKYIDKH